MTNETSDRPLRFFVVGASTGNPNGGVAALGCSIIDNLRRYFPDCEIMMSERGVDRVKSIELPGGRVDYETTWLAASNKWKHRSGTRHLALLSGLNRVLPGFGLRWFPNRTLQQIRSADALLDISGGDSFAEIYGSASFGNQCIVKEYLLHQGKPFILLPQTYGPFRSVAAEERAGRILQGSSLIATRESEGLQEVQKIVGELDQRFVECPDLAISMTPMPVPGLADLFSGDRQNQWIGINVSGLLWQSNLDVSMTSGYRELVWELLNWACSKPNTRVLLVPHVFNTPSKQQSHPERLSEYPELELALQLSAEAKQRWPDRVVALEQRFAAPELKWIIGQCGFFIGARMHACIAAASQAVPCAILAYSKKAAGVFATLDALPLVVDLRSLDNSQALGMVEQIYQDRIDWRQRLTSSVARAKERIEHFFTDHFKRAVLPSIHTRQERKG